MNGNRGIKSKQTAMRKCGRYQPREACNPAELAAAFAKVVTAPSDSPDDWVARNGDKSIFSALRTVLPEVTSEVITFIPSLVLN
jgi:hypothetical protein